MFLRLRPGHSEYFIIDRIVGGRRVIQFLGNSKFRFDICLTEITVEYTYFPKTLHVTFVHLMTIYIYRENLLF